jgi:hypothetical protein
MESRISLKMSGFILSEMYLDHTIAPIAPRPDPDTTILLILVADTFF